MTTLYSHALVGGTFDRLHTGHRQLLTTAFTRAEHVTIGLSTKELYRHKLFAQHIQSYEIRKKTLSAFLADHQWIKRSRIVPLSDIYGTSLTDSTLKAIIVSEETKNNALTINSKRKGKGMSPLEIISIPLVTGNDALPISSERIRKGEIDAEGVSYLKTVTQHDVYELPHELRTHLQQPIGKVLTDQNLRDLKDTHPFITAVGDITTLTLFQEGLPPAIAVIDGRTQRHSLSQDSLTDFFPLPLPVLINEAGTITSQAATVYQNAVSTYLSEKTTQLIMVQGEEDLLALPAMLLAPLYSLVLYGQQGIGIITTEITPEKKTYARNLLAQFRFRK